MKRFYLKNFNEAQADLELPENVAKHVFALRIKTGEKIILFNENFKAKAQIQEIKKPKVLVKNIEELKVRKSPGNKISVFQALPDFDSLKVIVRNLTQFDAEELNIFLGDFSQKFGLDENKLEKLRSISASVCQQCRRDVPLKIRTLNDPLSSDYHIQNDHHGIDIFLDPSADRIFQASAFVGIRKDQEIRIWAGPEGGFSDRELKRAVEKNFLLLRFDTDLILHCQNAATTAVAICKFTGILGQSGCS